MFQMKKPETRKTTAQLHCPMCTHTVPGEIEYRARKMRVMPGQKCQRCHASLDSAAVLYVREAA